MACSVHDTSSVEGKCCPYETHATKQTIFNQPSDFCLETMTILPGGNGYAQKGKFGERLTGSVLEQHYFKVISN